MIPAKNASLRPYLLLLVLSGLSLGGLLVGCKSSKNAGNAYDNMTARYNAYFLAKERMKEAEREIFHARQEDYNNILQVDAPQDSGAVNAQRSVMEDCLDKAAKVIQWHEDSKWVDDSYFLAGKARYYLHQYTDAATTFKYVNTKSPEEQTRFQALLELMRLFINTEQYDDARTAISYLSRQTLNKDNEMAFHLMRAHYYRKQGSYKQVAQYLTKALELMPRSEHKARIAFILGQVYQKYGDPKDAYYHYDLVRKNNPNYDLTFFSKLYALQCVAAVQNIPENKMMKAYKRLLRDDKNIDYEDKIYYEMGVYYLNKKDIPTAVDYLQKSVEVDKPNLIQSAYSFLKLADVNFEYLEQYERAKVYYDSALVNLPKTAESYQQTKQRRAVLDEFVLHLQTVRLEDSLQRLARMEPEARSAYLDYELQKQETRRQDEIERQAALAERRQRRSTGSSLNDPNRPGGGQAVWYFDNLTALTTGRAAFLKKWGKRDLEDNWRRSDKPFNESTDSLDRVVEIKISREDLIKQRVVKQKEALLTQLPDTEAKLDSSNIRLENSLYRLGRIYYYQLQDPAKSIVSFERLLKKFPNTEKAAEAHYFLYLAHQSLEQKGQEQHHKETILKKYPNSLYAKLIQNPNYLHETETIAQEVLDAYKKAFELYEKREFAEASSVIGQTLAAYPETGMNDKFAFLRVLISIKVSDPITFKLDLQRFVENYPESELKPRAMQLLQKAQSIDYN